MPFVPGQSGNPSGKHIITQEFRRSVRALAPDALRILEGVMRDPNHKEQVKAAALVLAYAHGTPPAGDLAASKMKLEIKKLRAEVAAIDAVKAASNDLRIEWSTTAPVKAPPEDT